MPTARFPHLSCGICFEGIQNWFWFAISRDHSVNVIGSCIECQEDPTPDLTSLSDSLLDSRSALRAKLHRWLLERSKVVFSPLLVGRNAWTPIAIMKTIYRPSSVAMKPSAVSSIPLTVSTVSRCPIELQPEEQTVETVQEIFKPT